MERAALVGYGRFGRVFAELLADAGLTVRAHDTAVEVPAARRADSLAAVTAGADVVVLAVPVSGMRPALEQLRPHLSPGQLVMDVGSVKVGPVQALAAVLGREVPWVGTHPLFGPDSLARGERPLRAVVCPSPLHPDAAARARALYVRLGCEVLEATPDVHDRELARTHALPLFLAHGMLEAGVSPDTFLAPPSFAPWARMLATVQGEAPHLLAAVQAENPYAREVREEVLEALGRAHRELEAAPEAPQPSAAPATPELEEVRAGIDALDRELVALLVRRVALARRAASAKAERGLPVMDAGREARMLSARRTWASEAGLSGEDVEAVFRTLLRLSRRALASVPAPPGRGKG